MLIEIAETHPPQFGKKVATVVAKSGDKFEIWPEKLAGLAVGGRYEVDVAEREFNGRTIRKITKARPASSDPSATAPAARNGCAPAAPVTGDEGEFVGRTLAALILKGEVRYSKQQLYEATLMLRGLWSATFGGRFQNGDFQ